MSDPIAPKIDSTTPGGGVYLSPSWLALKQQITYLAQFGGGIQVIQGMAGAGKSTLQQILLDEKICADYFAIVVQQNSEFTGLLTDLMWQLGLRPEQGTQLGELIVSLRAYVQSLHEEGERVVVAIDDAHFLADPALAALVSVLQGISVSGIGLHFILFSEPGLPERLDALQLLDVEIHDAFMPSLSVSELEQLFFARGLGLNQPLEPERLANIWRMAQGLPGPALEYWADSHQRSSKTATEQQLPTRLAWSGLPFGHIAALILLSSILVWAFLVRDKDVLPDSDSQPRRELLQVASSAEASSHSRALSVAAEVSPPLGRAEANLSQSKSLVLKSTNDSSSDAQKSTNNQSSSVFSAVSSVADGQSSAAQNVTIHDKMTSVSQSGSNIDTKEESVEGISIEQNSEIEPEAEGVKSQAGAERTATPNVTRAASPAVVQIQDRATYQFAESLLLGYPNDSYVLQIMAASDYERLRDFVKSQANHQNLLIYRAKRKGRLLFILVEGFYADKESAQAAAANLPSEQRKGSPWPKKIALIKQDIAEVR